MAFSKEQIIQIIENGKLDTYSQGKSFLQIYWKLNDSVKKKSYIFIFNGLTNNLIDIKYNDSNWHPIRLNPKKYVQKMNEIMNDLLSNLKDN